MFGKDARFECSTTKLYLVGILAVSCRPTGPDYNIGHSTHMGRIPSVYQTHSRSERQINMIEQIISAVCNDLISGH